MLDFATLQRMHVDQCDEITARPFPHAALNGVYDGIGDHTRLGLWSRASTSAWIRSVNDSGVRWIIAEIAHQAARRYLVQGLRLVFQAGEGEAEA